MKTIDEHVMQELRTGSTKPLTSIFEENYSYCIKHLIKQTGCTLEDSKDLVMDAIIVLREKILYDEYQNVNLQAFLVRVASNMWKNRQKRNRKILLLDPQIIEAHFSRSDNEFILDEGRQKKVNAILLALNKLGGSCEKLLRRNLIDRVPLQNLAVELDYKNKDVIKTTKSRCMKKFRAIINEILE